MDDGTFDFIVEAPGLKSDVADAGIAQAHLEPAACEKRSR